MELSPIHVSLDLSGAGDQWSMVCVRACVCVCVCQLVWLLGIPVDGLESANLLFDVQHNFHEDSNAMAAPLYALLAVHHAFCGCT